MPWGLAQVLENLWGIGALAGHEQERALAPAWKLQETRRLPVLQERELEPEQVSLGQPSWGLVREPVQALAVPLELVLELMYCQAALQLEYSWLERAQGPLSRRLIPGSLMAQGRGLAWPLPGAWSWAVAVGQVLELQLQQELARGLAWSWLIVPWAPVRALGKWEPGWQLEAPLKAVQQVLRLVPEK